MTTLVLVGGYLGAGKTTLIVRAASVLRARGRRVGVVLNDQDAGLVDTRVVEASGVPAREVAGGGRKARARRHFGRRHAGAQFHLVPHPNQSAARAL